MSSKSLLDTRKMHVRMISDFGDHVTLKTGVKAAEKSTLHYRNKLHFKIF